MASSDSDQENNNSNTRRSSRQRKLCYRDLLNRVEGMEESEELGYATVKGIGEIMKQVNAIELEHNISERYQYPDETLLDSMILSSASGLLIKCIENVDVNSSTYVADDFAAKIVKHVKVGDQFETENLLNLLEDAQNIIPKVPEYSYVFGAYDLNSLPQPKPKKERTKQQKERFEKKEPEKVKNLEKTEQSIDEIVKVFYNVLCECYEQNNQNPIKYYDYVIDTSSFSNTVENMFYCSFLIRDGKAHLDLDGKCTPFLKPVPKDQLKRFRSAAGTNSQVISSITFSEWETFKKEGYLQKYKNMRKQNSSST